MHGDGSQRLAISSAEPNDGKTTVSTNLAVAYHQAGKRVLLIDGDMRKPGLTRLTGFRSRPGLSDLLRDSRPVADLAAEMTHRSGDVPIDIIPSGKRPANPGELLLGDRLSELLAWAETVYDQIIVDAPPAIAGTDAAAIGRACEGLVLVVRPAFNRRRSIVQAVETLRGMGTKLHGIVINGVGMAVDTFGYGYAYEYGYGESDSDTDVDEESTDADASVGFDEVVQPTLPHPILRRSAA